MVGKEAAMRFPLLLLAISGLWAQQTPPAPAPAPPKPLPFQIVPPPTLTNEDRLRWLLQRQNFRPYITPVPVIKKSLDLELQSKTCSIPLLNVTPSAKGTIQVIQPNKPVAEMPAVRGPAPPCESSPSR
jgi:hypothetical protein